MKVLWSGGFAVVAAVVLFFVAVPAAPVPTAVYADNGQHDAWDVWNTHPGKFIKDKSGLKIAVEGRLKWLGLY